MCTYKKMVALMIILSFLFTTGCNLDKNAEVNNEWRKNTLNLFSEAEVGRGKYIPIELTLEKNKEVSLDDTWRYISIIEMLHGDILKKQEIKTSIYNYLNKNDNIELTDLCKIIYILEIIDPDSLKLKELKTFINDNIIDNNRQINSICYNENIQIKNNQSKSEEQKLNIIYFLSILKDDRILTDYNREVIIEYLLNFWENSEKNEENLLTNYSIILSLNNYNYDIIRIQGIENYTSYLNEEYKKIKQQPYKDLLKTDVLIELLQILDSDFIIENSIINEILNQQNGGFPLEENSIISGVGTYIVIRMLKNESFSDFMVDDLIKYITNKQSSDGMFEIDNFNRTNLLPSVISILAIKNLKDIKDDDINFVRGELKRLDELNNISLIEMYYTLTLLKDTKFFNESVDIVKNNIENSGIKINNINDAYFLFQIGELISEPMPDEMRTPINKYAETYLLKLIEEENDINYEQLYYCIVLLNKNNVVINKDINLIINNSKNERSFTIGELYYYVKCSNELNVDLPDNIYEEFNEYFSKNGGFKSSIDNEEVTLLGTYFGTELIVDLHIKV